jgi:hypothetical protein
MEPTAKVEDAERAHWYSIRDSSDPVDDLERRSRRNAQAVHDLGTLGFDFFCCTPIACKENYVAILGRDRSGSGYVQSPPLKSLFSWRGLVRPRCSD